MVGHVTVVLTNSSAHISDWGLSAFIRSCPRAGMRMRGCLTGHFVPPASKEELVVLRWVRWGRCGVF